MRAPTWARERSTEHNYACCELIGVALVGCGGMGRRHLAGYAALEHAGGSAARMVAVCDEAPELAEAAAEQFAAATGRLVRVHPSLGAVLADREVEAVDLVIPNRFHHQAVVRALEGGRHVLVEKPFGITMRACRLMAETAARTGLVLAVAENYRRVPTHRALHGLLEQGVIGRPFVVSVHTVQQALAPDEGGWFRDRRMVGSRPNLEFAVHEADLLLHLFGEVEEVYAHTPTFEGPDEDAGLALLKFRSGVHGQLLVLAAGHGGATGGRLVVGSKGRVESRRWEGWEQGVVALDGQAPVSSEDWIAGWLGGLDPTARERMLPAGSWDPAQLTVELKQPLRYGIATEIHDFARAVAEGGEPEVGAEAGTASVALCLAILESAATGRPVAPADVLAGRSRKWQADLDAELGLG
jgi:predicted dehydrogenase